MKELSQAEWEEEARCQAYEFVPVAVVVSRRAAVEAKKMKRQDRPERAEQFVKFADYASDEAIEFYETWNLRRY